MIPAILQLVGAILLAVLIFLRSDKKSIQATMTVVTVQGKKNPKIKDAIQETWIIRIGLILVIIGYILQILGIDSEYLLGLSRVYKAVYTVIVSFILTIISMFIASKIAKFKFEKIKPFDINNKEDDDQVEGSIMIKFDD
ncbi:hypothetical protein P4679_33515 [Priestia megaterium]|uniref:hypothetical protein n=1 Tax=Priestia megaterium TaxID=1404 RepID=UPI002E1D1DCF|nr:hypothetical protein [Priestia megaterium]